MATLQNVLEGIMDDLDDFEEEFIEQLNESIKQKTPVLTGALKEAFKVEGDTIINDKEYFNSVEYGTRSRPPVGMVRRSVIEAQQIADKATKKVATNV